MTAIDANWGAAQVRTILGAPRIDDTNRRILTKKFELGLFERPMAGRAYSSTVGNGAHRALARRAVARSQVVLKNAGNVLPIARNGNKVFVAGKNADNIGNQSGGFTISWQGEAGNTAAGTTILQAPINDGDSQRALYPCGKDCPAARPPTTSSERLTQDGRGGRAFAVEFARIGRSAFAHRWAQSAVHDGVGSRRPTRCIKTRLATAQADRNGIHGSRPTRGRAR
jgi:hypothetical protein